MRKNAFKGLLKSRGVNVKALTERLGVSYKEMKAWINGKATPHILYVKEMALLLEMPLEKLWEVIKCTRK